MGGNNKTKYRENIDGCGGAIYGDEQLNVINFGSGGGGGGYGDSKGGNGGGILIIDCKQNVYMDQASAMKAIGGRNKQKGNGGNGGDGRIRIKCTQSKNIQL